MFTPSRRIANRTRRNAAGRPVVRYRAVYERNILRHRIGTRN
jgi:hypothetical protein